MSGREVPSFFVPEATESEQESVYAEFAKACGTGVPQMRKRIYSIVFDHDGEEWTATVGEKLRGLRVRRRHSRDRATEVDQPLSDPATVLAIFPGVPYMVMTTKFVGVQSAWECPFMAGQPKSVTPFRETSDATN